MGTNDTYHYGAGYGEAVDDKSATIQYAAADVSVRPCNLKILKNLRFHAPCRPKVKRIVSRTDPSRDASKNHRALPLPSEQTASYAIDLLECVRVSR